MTPAYLRALRAEVLNATYDLIDAQIHAQYTEPIRLRREARGYTLLLGTGLRTDRS